MSSVAISLIVWHAARGARYSACFCAAFSPEDHLNADSKSTVNLGIGLIGTMSGIALGLLVASAAGKYDTQKNELTKLSADFVLLEKSTWISGRTCPSSFNCDWTGTAET